MKKQFTAAAALLLTLSLFGCARKAPAETAAPTETVPQTQAATTLPTIAETAAVPTGETYDPAAMAAYRAALQKIRDEHYWPNMEPNDVAIELFEPATFDDEQFALCDVDDDGQKELIVSITDTAMAGMCEAVYGYDAATGGVRLEAQSFPGSEYYTGLIKDIASHNQGYAGEVLWPYSLSTYDKATDSYVYQCYVDAWTKAISDTYFDGTKYPDDIDVNHDGYVYLITDKDGNVTTLNKADYEAWETKTFAGLAAIDIPWQKMTAENVSAVG